MAELKQQRQQQAGVRRVGSVLVLLMAGFISVFVFATQWKNTLTIQRVVVEGAHILDAHEIVSLANMKPQVPLYETDIFTIQRNLFAQPLIKSAVINRELPDELYITIVERDPIAALKNSQLYCIDCEGVILPHRVSATTFDLPLVGGINGIDTVHMGGTLNQEDAFEAITILQTAQRMNLYRLISEVNMNNGGDITLYSTEGGVPILLGRGDLGKKLLMLQSFWNNFVNPDAVPHLRCLDLRYDGQVVAKWDRQKETTQAKVSL